MRASQVGEGGAGRQRDEVYTAAENLLGGEVMTLVRKIRTLQVGRGGNEGGKGERLFCVVRGGMRGQL